MSKPEKNDGRFLLKKRPSKRADGFRRNKIVEQHKADEVRWRASAQHIQEEATKLLNLSGMSIPTDCSIKDFEEHIQRNMKQSGNIS
ncbi:unnamed protein product [Rotaria magnacalcarata]|uniref:Uncharacterized protein n=1 Tax=Rotaria magnacalcarata TaxID=392030 RepID=A0A8S3IA26_9BILA|nr:unnamed protein product [Rotaria magnacalcarata]